MRILPYLRTLKNIKFFKRIEVNDKVYNIVRIFDPAKKPTRYFTPFYRPISKKLIPWKAIGRIIDEDEYLITHNTFLRSFELFNKNILDYVHYVDNDTCNYKLYFNFAYGKPDMNNGLLDPKFISSLSSWFIGKGWFSKDIILQNEMRIISESTMDFVFVLDFSPINLIVPKLYYGLKSELTIIIKNKSFNVEIHNPFIIGKYYLKGKELIKPEFFMTDPILSDIGKKCNNAIMYLNSIPLFSTWRELFDHAKMYRFIKSAEIMIDKIDSKFKNMYYVTWIWSWLLEHKYPELQIDASLIIGDYVNSLLDKKLISINANKKITIL